MNTLVERFFLVIGWYMQEVPYINSSTKAVLYREHWFSRKGEEYGEGLPNISGDWHKFRVRVIPVLREAGWFEEYLHDASDILGTEYSNNLTPEETLKWVVEYLEGKKDENRS